MCLSPPCAGSQGVAAPPPPPLWSLCHCLRGSGWPGGGGVAAGQLRTHTLWQGFPTALIHQDMTRHLAYLTYHPPSYRGTPLQARRSWRQCSGQQQGRAGGEGGNQRLEAWVGGGGGKGVGNHVCKWSNSLFLQKTMRPLNLKSSHTHCPACCNYYTLMIRSSLKDWQSMKKCTFARHSTYNHI